VVSAAATTGCGSGGEKKSAPLPEAFCRAAEAFDSKMTASRKPPVREQVRLVEAMARTAPPDIRDDARAFLTAMRRVEKDPHDPARSTSRCKGRRRRETAGAERVPVLPQATAGSDPWGSWSSGSSERRRFQSATASWRSRSRW